MRTRDTHPIVRNVQDVAELEERWRSERSTPLHAFGLWVIGIVGSPAGLALQVAFLLAWVLINADPRPPFRAFDPYPFNLLSLVLGIEAITLSTFVLIVQQHMSRAQERRDHLNLQLSIITEQETTRTLQLLRHVAARLGIEQADDEVLDMVERTDLGAMAMHIEDKVL